MILGRSKQKAAEPQPAAKAEAPKPAAAAPAQVEVEAPKASARPRDSRQIQFAQNFAQVVAVLMRDPNFRKLPLGDLEWLVLPPLMAGQVRLAHMQAQADKDNQSGMLVPVAVALWARVSPEVDKMLAEKLDEPTRLQPNQWVSGDKLWLMAVAGDQRAIPAFLQQLAKNDFNGKEVKMRRRGADGKVVVATLGQGE